VDWTKVDGIDVQVAQTIIAEVGTDLRSFPSEKHFSKWLGRELSATVHDFSRP
jgi:transposase